LLWIVNWWEPVRRCLERCDGDSWRTGTFWCSYSPSFCSCEEELVWSSESWRRAETELLTRWDGETLVTARCKGEASIWGLEERLEREGVSSRCDEGVEIVDELREGVLTAALRQQKRK
jgi:hypothetical protein